MPDETDKLSVDCVNKTGVIKFVEVDAEKLGAVGDELVSEVDMVTDGDKRVVTSVDKDVIGNHVEETALVWELLKLVISNEVDRVEMLSVCELITDDNDLVLVLCWILELLSTDDPIVPEAELDKLDVDVITESVDKVVKGDGAVVITAELVWPLVGAIVDKGVVVDKGTLVDNGILVEKGAVVDKGIMVDKEMLLDKIFDDDNDEMVVVPKFDLLRSFVLLELIGKELADKEDAMLVPICELV